MGLGGTMDGQDPQVEPDPTLLSELLRVHRREILATWEGRIRARGLGGGLSHGVLLDHLPELLDDLAEVTGRLERAKLGRFAARLHTVDRLSEGFDLQEVVAEFALLREVIIDTWADASSPVPAGSEAWRTIHGAIDTVIAAAVQRYAHLQQQASAAHTRILEEREARLRAVERALGASEGRFKAFLDHSPSTVYIRDPDGRFLYCNETLGRLLHLDVSEIVGKRDRDLFDPAVADEFLANDRRVREAGRAVTFEEHADFGEGPRTYLTIKFPVHDLDGSFLGIGGFSTDITARKEIESALQRQAAELETVIESMPEAVVVAGESGIRSANRRALELLGFDDVESLREGLPALIGRLDVRWAETGTPMQVQEAPVVVALRGTPARAELLVRDTATGGRRVLRTSAAPIRFREGTVGVIVVVSDVTDRKRTESGLRLLAEAGDVLSGPAEAKHLVPAMTHLLVPRFADWCWIRIEPVGAGPGYTAVAHADPAREARLAGLGDEAPVRIDTPQRGLFLPRVSAAEAARRVPDAARRALLEEAGLESLIAVPLVVQEEPVGLCVLGRGPDEPCFDARDLQIASELARRGSLVIENVRLLEQAQHAVRLREDVLAMVSHDLKSPLSAILLGASAVGRSDLDPLAKKQLVSIRHAAERMEALIRNLLDMARLRADRFGLDLDVHDVCRLVHEALELQRPLAEAAGLELVHVEAPGPLAALCDRERILQVLSNLVGNAVNYCDRGDRITIRTTTEGAEVHVSVADTGPGITPEVQSRLFSPWWSGASPGRRTGSSGLGLFIARGIVETHGGRIWLESEPGRGTTFHFTLPLAQSEGPTGRDASG